MARTSHLTLLTGTQSGSGTSGYVEVGEYDEALVTLNVTAASGSSPTLAVKLQVSDDSGTTWYDLPNGSFTQATGATTQALAITNFGDILRANFTIGGTSPSFTFALKVMGKDRSGRN